MRKNALISICFMAMALTACANGSSEQETTVASQSTTSEATTSAETTTETTTEAETTQEEVTTEETTTVEDATGEVADTTEEQSDSDATGAVAEFNKIWALFDDASMFPAVGGSVDNMADGMPGSYDMSDKDSLTNMFCIPEDCFDKIDDMASLMHMMNANTFTGAVLHVNDAQAVADAIKTTVDGTQWICGAPEKFAAIKISDEYVAYAFGASDLVTSFITNSKAAYDAAEVLYDVDIVIEF